MRVITMLCALPGLFALQYANGQDNRLSLSNNKPVAGQSITITYNPQGSPLAGKELIQAEVYYMGKGTAADDVDLEHEGAVWTGKIQIPADTKAFFFKVHKGTEKDKNDEKGFIWPIYQDGKPVPGAYASEASFYSSLGNYYTGIKKDTLGAIKMYEKEFSLYPESANTYKSSYYRYLILAKRPGVNQQIEQEIALLLKGNTEKDLMKAQSYFALLNKRAQVDSLSTAIKNRFPDGELAMNDAALAFYKEKDIDKKQRLYDAYTKAYTPEQAANGMIGIDDMKLMLASAYLQRGMYAQFEAYAGQVTDKSRLAPMLNTAAYEMAQKGTDLDKAAQLSKQSLDLADNNRKNPVQTKPRANTLSAWKKIANQTYGTYADTYAFILYKQGKYQEALAYQKPVYDGSKGPEVSEHYALIVAALGNNQEAMDIFERLVKTGRGSKDVKGELKKAYVKVKGSEAGYDEYLTSLTEEARAKSREAIAQQAINEPAPAFAIKDLNGKTIALQDLKGKVVIVDFWATWCGPCKASLPGMQMAVNKYKNNPDVVFLFIDTWETDAEFIAEVKKFVADHHYNDMHVLIDEKGSDGRQAKVVSSYQVTGIPTKFVIDKDGNIRFKVVGFSGSVDALVDEVSSMVDIATTPYVAKVKVTPSK